MTRKPRDKLPPHVTPQRQDRHLRPLSASKGTKDPPENSSSPTISTHHKCRPDRSAAEWRDPRLHFHTFAWNTVPCLTVFFRAFLVEHGSIPDCRSQLENRKRMLFPA